MKLNTILKSLSFFPNSRTPTHFEKPNLQPKNAPKIAACTKIEVHEWKAEQNFRFGRPSSGMFQPEKQTKREIFRFAGVVQLFAYRGDVAFAP
jgi:hypothetical protein